MILLKSILKNEINLNLNFLLYMREYYWFASLFVLKKLDSME